MEVRMREGWREDLDDAIDDTMDRLVEDITDDAQRFAPVHDPIFDRYKRNPTPPGRLRETIVSYSIGEKKWRLHAQAPYAAYVELGTRPHEIRPRDAKELRWTNATPGGYEVGVAGGFMHFSKLVHHPGTKPNSFLRAAVTANRG